jgi:hypothetical protein
MSNYAHSRKKLKRTLANAITRYSQPAFAGDSVDGDYYQGFVEAMTRALDLIGEKK